MVDEAAVITILCCVHGYHVVFMATMLCSWLPCCVHGYHVVFMATMLCSWLPCCVHGYHVVWTPFVGEIACGLHLLLLPSGNR